MDKAEFVKDFSEFYIELRKEGVDELFKNITMLYAIYKKDRWADRFNYKISRNSKPADPGIEPGNRKAEVVFNGFNVQKWCLYNSEGAR